MTSAAAPKVVVIGGGTGSFVLLSHLKRLTSNLTAIVNMADDGGSSGVLRDELGALPPGDVRQCLVALAPASHELRELFTYRFEEGSLGGHSFGNLFLSALEKTTGEFAEAVRVAGRILNITGQVVPVTLTSTHLVWSRPEGEPMVGEFQIAYADLGGARPELSLEPTAELNPEAKAAIVDADLVVIAPGSLYGSLAPALLVEGMAEALASTRGKVAQVCNLVTYPGQTDGYGPADFATEVERFAGGPVLDYLIYNTAEPEPEIRERYEAQGEHLVLPRDGELERAHYEAVGRPLLAGTVAERAVGDITNVPRSLIRHDGPALAKLVMELARE